MKKKNQHALCMAFEWEWSKHGNNEDVIGGGLHLVLLLLDSTEKEVHHVDILLPVVDSHI